MQAGVVRLCGDVGGVRGELGEMSGRFQGDAITSRVVLEEGRPVVHLVVHHKPARRAVGAVILLHLAQRVGIGCERRPWKAMGDNREIWGDVIPGPW